LDPKRGRSHLAETGPVSFCLVPYRSLVVVVSFETIRFAAVRDWVRHRPATWV